MSRNLRTGNLLLLVVGEGIREGVEGLTQIIQRAPGLRFHLELIEVALYREKEDQEWPLHVYPRVVARTEEVVRAVVVVEPSSGATRTRVEAPPPSTERPGARPPRLDEVTFFERLRAQAGEETAAAVRDLLRALGSLDLKPTWGASFVTVRFQDPSSSPVADRWIAVLGLGTDGSFFVPCYDYLHRDRGYSSSVAKEYTDTVRRLTGGSKEAMLLYQVRADYLAAVQAFMDRVHDEHALGAP
jgi:hypothetical protein